MIADVEVRPDGRAKVSFASPTGTPIREAIWARDGDPGCRVPYVDITTVTREFTKKGAMVVTFSPPGRVSGESKPPRVKKRGLPAFAEDRHDGRNGRVHSVRGIGVPRVPVAEPGDDDALVAASAPPEMTRFGPDADEAAKAFAGTVPGQ